MPAPRAFAAGKAKRAAKSPASQALDAVDAAIEAAAGQLVQKALKFISIDDNARKGPSPRRPAAEPQFRFDSSFLDKGLDAINGVGKLMEGFAVTLDSVIGHAFQGAPSKAGGECGAVQEAELRQHVSRRSVATLPAATEPQQQQQQQRGARGLTLERPTSAPLTNGWEDFDVENKENRSDSSLASSSRQQGKQPSSFGAAGSLQPPARDLASSALLHAPLSSFPSALVSIALRPCPVCRCRGGGTAVASASAGAAARAAKTQGAAGGAQAVEVSPLPVPHPPPLFDFDVAWAFSRVIQLVQPLCRAGSGTSSSKAACRTLAPPLASCPWRTPSCGWAGWRRRPTTR